MRELVRTIERALEQEHEKALTYAMQYGTGWDRADEAYKRLRAFKEALERREAATASKKATRKLAA